MEIVFTVEKMMGGLIGGAMMGGAASILMLFNGRIMGACGISNGIFYFEKNNVLWRILFVIGMAAGGAILWTSGFEGGNDAFDASAIVDTPILLIAGFLTGLGTSLGRGCTTGHGICGMSRMSINSFVATGCFMGSAIVTVYIIKHVL